MTSSAAYDAPPGAPGVAPAAVAAVDSRDRRALPLALSAAALTAFLALYVNARQFAIAPLLACPALGLVATYVVTKARLPDRPLVRWILRALTLAILFVVVSGLPTTGVALWYFEPEYTRFTGVYLSVEFVIRAWTRYAPPRVPRARRVMLFISGLVMVAASNTFERLPFNVLAPVYMLCVALTLRDFTRDAAPPLAPVRTAGRPPRRLPLALLRGTAVTLTLLLGAVTVFLVTRYDNAITTFAFNLLRAGRAPLRGSAIGFSTAPRLTAVFNPDATLDRALLIDGPPGERHVRILAFDTYDHTFWHPPVKSRPFAPVGMHVVATTGPTTTAANPATAPAQTLHVTRLIDLADLLAVPSDATSLHTRGEVDRDALGTFRDPGSGDASTAYDVTVPSHGSGELDPVPLAARPSAAERFRLLTVPAEIDPRVAALAREVTAGAPAPTPAQRVARIAQHLRATHAYSLSFEPQPHADPLNDFILNRRDAHCQYFASAMVILARAAGVPARLVTGYYAHEPYGDDQTVVRERDAHAWAECYLDDVGQWVTVDATPAGGRPDGLFPDPPRWRRFFEHLRDLPTYVRTALRKLAATPALIAVVVAAVLILVAAAARHLRLRRRRRPRSATRSPYPTPAAELRDAAARFERWLRERRGRPLSPSQTWRDQARPLAPANPLVLDFLNAYDTARFGPADPSLFSQLRTILTQLERSASPRSPNH